jgi:hemoglobin-like flavoprotein
MLTAQDIATIRWQFHTIEPFSDAIGAEFLARLFWATPQARDCFPKNVFEARGKVFELIALAVAQLERIETVAPAVDALLTHSRGVAPVAGIETAICMALLGTLESRLEGEFSASARSAWSRAFWMLANHVDFHSTTPALREAA